MYSLIKSLLFLIPPEKAHTFTTSALDFLIKIPGIRTFMKAKFVVSDPALKRTIFGIDFPNPVGLAAGFDKNAEHLNALQYCGFGFIEIGTVTPKGQSGNPQPRLFRLPKNQALINRLGFNNRGAEEAKKKLKNRPDALIIGGNIGKNKVTPNENADSDYLECFEQLFEYVDYFVVNVSSPNTPELRQLQEKEPLERLLKKLQQANHDKPVAKPLLLKIAPDLNAAQLSDIVAIVKTTGIDGIIATNTTINRTGLSYNTAQLEKIGAGGLSGKPLLDRSNEILRFLRKELPDLPLIGVGGITSPEAALEKLKAGADLIQLYTGFVYGGPGLIKEINQAILRDN